MRAPTLVSLLLVAALLVVALLVACGGRKAEPEHPVLLIGVDGLEWSVMGPLLEQGLMPNLRKLIERGTCGELTTIAPALSPAIWTSVATGTEPRVHGIKHFLDPSSGVPYTSKSRRGPALWNIASEYGLKTLCVGWWMTWPAEEIEGWMVAPYSSAGQNQENWKGSLRENLPDQTWPRELVDEVWPIAERIGERSEFLEIDRPYFGGVDLDRLGEKERELVKQTRWSVMADTTFVRIAKHLLDQPDVAPDLTMLYLGGPDVASHRFWRYRCPSLYRYEAPASSLEELSPIIHRFYAQADRMIGDVLASAPADANVIVCSDHGFRAVFTDAPDPEGSGYSGHHLDGPRGVVILSGPSFREGPGKAALAAGGLVRPPPLGRIYEVAPLVLYLLDVPTARNMDVPNGGSLVKNGVREDLLARRSPEPTVNAHLPNFRLPEAPKEVDPLLTEGILENLAELGYLESLGASGDFTEVLPRKNDPQVDKSCN